MRSMKSGIFNRRASIIVCGLFLCLLSGTSSAQDQLDKNKYQRCSIINMMIEHPMYMYNDEIAAAFRALPVQDRFNDHSLGVNVVKFASADFRDQTENIYSFIEQTHLGNRAIAKWFGWNKADGSFNMELVKQRGFYNANLFDRELAEATLRGNSILYDAGEKLISNTYLIMHDICYSGKYSAREGEEKGFTGEKRKFKVTITSYIFQLEWTDDDLNNFYYNYYKGVGDFIHIPEQYRFVFRAKVETRYSDQTYFLSQPELIKKTVARCLDINIAKLQRAYPDFQIKATLLSGETLRADIGLKEGITEDDLFEVLLKHEDERGVVSYERVGVVKPEKGKIWDNRYMATEEKLQNANIGYTTFEKISGIDFFPGLLLREMNTK